MFDFADKVLTTKGPALFSVGQAGYIIKSSNGQLMCIDLYLSNCVERIEGTKGFKRLLPQILSAGELSFDVVICTHAHSDHFDVDSIPELLTYDTKLLCSVGCEKLVMQYNNKKICEQTTYVKPGDKALLGDFDITFVNCDHGLSAPDAVGVVVKVDGRIIYEAGDTCLRLDYIYEIPQPLDILIAPINGMYGNMDSRDVADLSEAIHPVVTIPCHYGMFVSHGGDLKSFCDIMDEKNLPFLVMQQGEEYSI